MTKSQRQDQIIHRLEMIIIFIILAIFLLLVAIMPTPAKGDTMQTVDGTFTQYEGHVVACDNGKVYARYNDVVVCYPTEDSYELDENVYITKNENLGTYKVCKRK